MSEKLPQSKSSSCSRAGATYAIFARSLTNFIFGCPIKAFSLPFTVKEYIMSETESDKEIFSVDEELYAVKHKIQRQCREDVASGRLKQSDLFLISREAARRAIITYKA